MNPLFYMFWQDKVCLYFTPRKQKRIRREGRLFFGTEGVTTRLTDPGGKTGLSLTAPELGGRGWPGVGVGGQQGPARLRAGIKAACLHAAVNERKHIPKFGTSWLCNTRDVNQLEISQALEKVATRGCIAMGLCFVAVLLERVSLCLFLFSFFFSQYPWIKNLNWHFTPTTICQTSNQLCVCVFLRRVSWWRGQCRR